MRNAGVCEPGRLCALIFHCIKHTQALVGGVCGRETERERVCECVTERKKERRIGGGGR